MSGKAYVQTRDGDVVEVPKEQVKAKLESGDYLPATAADKAAADKAAANSTLGAKAKTFAESAAAGAVDTIEAPIALPLRANAALWGDEDPIKNISGRATVENAANIFGEAKNRVTGENQTGEAYGREYGEGARERAQANPGYHAAGNLAGSLAAGGALSGGAGALGAGATKALGGGALGRAGGALVSGAAEGAAYGQAQAGEEAYLHNIPLSGEKLIAAMGWGAVLGGGVSLAAHGAGALLRHGSRGATPLDSPRLNDNGLGVSGEADVGGPLDAADGPAVARETSPKYEVNVGAFDKTSMRPESSKFMREHPERANELGLPRIDVYEGEPPAVGDGRHRMQAAIDRGETSIDANVRHYDKEGNLVSEGTQPIALTDTGPSQTRGNWAHTSIRELPAETAGAALDASGLPAADSAPAPGKLSSGIREFADQRTMKALGATQSTLKRMGRNYESAAATSTNVARAVRDATLDDGTKVFQWNQSPVELAERTEQATQEAGQKLGAFRERADKIFEAHPEIAPDVGALADRIEKDVVGPLDLHPSSLERSKAGAVRQWVNDIRATAAPSVGESEPFAAKVSDLTKLRQALDEQIYQVKRGVNMAQQGAPPNLLDLQKVRGMLEEQIEASTDKAATFFDKSEAGTYKALKTQYRNLKLASDIAGEGAMRQLGNRVVSPSDYGAGIAGAALTGSPIGSVLTGIAHKAVREHASAVAAVLADKLANTLDGKLESGLGAFFRESTARAAASAGEAGQAVAAVPIRRIATPAAVDAFLGKSKDLSAAYEKRVAELSNATRDMGAGVRASMQAAMGGAYETMPRLSQAATVTATRGAQYLQAQLPSGTAAPTVFQPSRKITPSDLQIREFAQKWAAISNPLSVVDDLRRGTVTHAQIDAIKAVYPAMYAEIQTKALEQIRELDAKGKRMPFNDRLQLDLFLDLNGAGEPTLDGKFIDRIAKAQADKAAKDSQQKPHASGGALAKLGTARQSGAQTALGG